MDHPARTLPRRLHAISGVVPVGAFLAFHLAVNASASRGADAYNAMARRLQEWPAAIWIEVLLIAVPLAYHGLYGLYLIAVRPAAGAEAPARKRGLALFLRATGAPLFAFILFHLWTTRLVQVRDHGSIDLFHWMQALYASPWIRAAYVCGLLAATSHFSAGLWSLAEDEGLARTSAARFSAAAFAIAVFVALTSLGIRALSAFRI